MNRIDLPKNSQFIEFNVTEYLACYFAKLLNTTIVEYKGIYLINLTRNTSLGKTILEAVQTSTRASKIKKGAYYLNIDEYRGDKTQTPSGRYNFLKIEPENLKIIIDVVKEDFKTSLTTFVQASEWIHRRNGWQPHQKKLGVRKYAILHFLKENNIKYEKRDLHSFIKLCQRFNNKHNSLKTSGLDKITVAMSFKKHRFLRKP